MTQKNDLNSQASRCSCTALRKASRRISQLYDAALAPSGLKTTQRAILAQISRCESTKVGGLAEALVMDAGFKTTTRKIGENSTGTTGFVVAGLPRYEKYSVRTVNGCPLPSVLYSRAE
jgi:hypothetical protein